MRLQRFRHVIHSLRKVAILGTTLTVALTQIFAAPAHAALSQADKEAIYNWPLYSPCVTTGASAAAPDLPALASLTGNQRISGTFVLGFQANTSKATIENVFKKYKPAGLYILGTTNAAAAGFNQSFFSKLAQDADHSILASSDEEGIFHRYKYKFDFPSAKQMGGESVSEVRQTGENVGNAMLANGLNTDLAPVLDVAKNSSDTDAGTPGRAFSDNPDTVASKAGAFAAGLNEAGINPVYKHFPGLGSSSGNTDTGSVTSPPLSQLEKKDLIPYSKIVNQNRAAVMLDNAHVPGLTGAGEGNVASTSKAAVNLLRGKYNFSGLIVTDDLTAAGVQESTAIAVGDALTAGVDAPLFTYTTTSVIDMAIAQAKTDGVNTDSALQQLDDFLPPTPASNSSGSSGQCCPTGSSGGGGTTSVSSGGNNVQIAYSFFVANGFSPTQSAGIVGNLMEESGPSLNPAITNSIGAHGIAQWLGGRLTQEKLWVTAQSGNPDSLGGQTGKPKGQLDFIIQELKTTFTSVRDKVKSANNLSDVVHEWNTQYEISGASDAPRLAYAQQVLSKYGGSGGGGSTGNNPSCSTSTGGAAGCNDPFRDINNLRPERIDQGVDYAGTGTVYAVCGGKITNISGEGGWNYGGADSFITVQFTLNGHPVTSYMAEGCTPRVKPGATVTDTTPICTLLCNTGSISTCTGIETGWAPTPIIGTMPLAQEYHGNGSASTTAGMSYNKFLTSLGTKSGVQTNKPIGTPLPSYYPQ